MECVVTRKDFVAVFTFSGRLDAVGAHEATRAFEAGAPDDVLCAVFDLSGVGYLSSAGVRVFLKAHRVLGARGGTLALAGAGDYVREVLKLTGLDAALPLFPAVPEALAHCRKALREKYALDNWERLETAAEARGRFRFVPGSTGPAKALILGKAKDVLAADITSAMVYSRRFSETEYSFGLGGLGGAEEDYFRIMGDMMTFGGAMFWQPADGSDAPDYLIPRTDSGEVRLRTPFNVSFAGPCGEYVMFESAEPGGMTLSDLVAALFRLSARRRNDFKGLLGLAVWAEMLDVYGESLRIAPVAELAPENREAITHPDNVDLWFERDEKPRAENVSCLLCGLAATDEAELSGARPEDLEAVFSDSGAGSPEGRGRLRVNGVTMKAPPLPERLADLGRETARLLDAGEFLDMRRILPVSRVRRAFMGLWHVQEILREGAGEVRETAVDIKRLRAMAMARYMEASGKPPSR